MDKRISGNRISDSVGPELSGAQDPHSPLPATARRRDCWLLDRLLSVAPGMNSLRIISTSSSQRESAHVRIARAMDILGMLIDESDARKPTLQPGDEWVTDMLDRMKDGNFISQSGREYVNSPATETGEIYTRWKELSGDTVAAALEAKRLFPNIQVAVPGFRGRKPNHALRVAQFDAADAIILCKGDMHATYQFIQALDYLRSGRAAELSADKRHKILVISAFDFYQPFFKGLFGIAPRGGSEQEFYKKALKEWIGKGGKDGARARIVFVDSLQKVSEKHLLAANQSRKDDVDKMFVTEREFPQLFVGTTKEEKIEDWREGIDDHRVRIRSLFELIDRLGEPGEQHRTYAGNARGTDAHNTRNSGKSESYRRTIKAVLDGQHASVSRAELQHRAALHGIDATRGDSICFIADDRGFEMPDWLLLEPYFPAELKQEILDLVRSKVGDQDLSLQRAPGVESTFWINAAGGVHRLMEYFVRAYERRERETGESIPRRVTSVCVAAPMEMNVDTGEAMPSQYLGATTYELRRPALGVDPNITESWYVPQKCVNPKQLSVTELMAERSGDDAFKAELPWVKVLNAMAADGLRFRNDREIQPVVDYRVTFAGSPAGNRRVAWQQQIRAHATAQFPEASAAAQVDLIGSLPVNGGGDAEYLFDPYAIGEHIRQSDAIVFDSVPLSTLGRARVLYEYFSALVLTSLRPDCKNIRVMINGSDPSLRILNDLVRTQNKYGLSEHLDAMAHTYANDTDAIEAMKRHWARYERLPLRDVGALSDVAKRDQFDVVGELNRSLSHELPSVVVLASAKSMESGLVRETMQTARCIAASHHHLITGGGENGLMGTAYKSFHEWGRMIGAGGRAAGISTKMVISKETADGRLPESFEVKNVTEDIITRMFQLFKADLGVFLGGGIGTAEEIGFVLAMKAAGQSLVKDKPMLLVNSLMPDGKRLCDGYLEFFGAAQPSLNRKERIEAGRRILEKMGVYVVEADRRNFGMVFMREFERACELRRVTIDSNI